MTRVTSCLLLCLLAAGCSSTPQRADSPFRGETVVTGGRVVDGSFTVEEAGPRPAATVPAPADPRGRRGETVVSQGEGKAPPVRVIEEDTPIGKRTTTIKPIGWHCYECGRTFNVEGWCHGKELKKVP